MIFIRTHVSKERGGYEERGMKKERGGGGGGGGANKLLHTMICLSSYDSADTYFKLTRFNTIRWSVYDESIVLK